MSRPDPFPPLGVSLIPYPRTIAVHITQRTYTAQPNLTHISLSRRCSRPVYLAASSLVCYQPPTPNLGGLKPPNPPIPRSLLSRGQASRGQALGDFNLSILSHHPSMLYHKSLQHPSIYILK
jgi:hypothetical protein